MKIIERCQFNQWLYETAATVTTIEDYRDALIPTLGVKMDNLSFIYSYDFNIAELISYGANTHEISLIVNLDCNGKRNDKIRPIPCYAFFN